MGYVAWLVLCLAARNEEQGAWPGAVSPSEAANILPKTSSRSEDSGRECGLYCLGYMAQLRGLDIGLDEMRKKVPVGEEGTSLLELREAAKSFGMPMKVVQVAPDHLAQLSLPAIAHFEPADVYPYSHYVVLLKVNPDSVVLFDWIARAVHVYNRRDFALRASGFYLAPYEAGIGPLEWMAVGITVLVVVAVVVAWKWIDRPLARESESV